MAADVVLVLQGGGALGAFECGVWKVLAPALRAGGHRLAVVGGASIGALNAAVIASRYTEPDQGTAALERFWRESLATAPLPFMPLPGNYFEAWNGLLTGLFCGNRSLYRPEYLNWSPLAGRQRIARPFFDTVPMRRTVQELLGGPVYEPQPGSPVLFMRSTDLQQGTSETFHSRHHRITAEMLRASGSMPLIFPAIALDGVPHVDGDAGAHSALGGAIDVLREVDPRQLFGGDEPPLLINVELHQRASDELPCTGLEMAHRLVNALQAGKSDADLALLASEAEHAEVMRELDAMLSIQPDGAAARLVRQQLARLKLRRAPQVRPRIVQIGREALPNEHVSNFFDYSPVRIDALIRQGMEEARRCLQRELPELARCVEAAPGRAGLPAAPPQFSRPHLHTV